MGQVTTEQWLENIQVNLLAELTKNQSALPNGFNQQRFILNCITVIRDMLKDGKTREALQKVDPASIPICLAKGAYLGLDFFNGECYAIPYGKEMQFQTDYKGEVKICKAYSRTPIKDIFAKNVRKDDFFEEEVVAGMQNVTFKPEPFSNKEIRGSFAVVLYEDGTMKYDTMSKEEIESVRDNFSKAKNSPAWVKSPGEMYKKTVLRRLCKTVDLNFDNIEQLRAYHDGADVEFKNDNILTGSQAALPDKGATVNVFEVEGEARELEPVPAGNSQTTNENEFMQFEQRYEQSYANPNDYDDNGLPWK